MKTYIPSFVVYEEELQKHKFTFTIPFEDHSGFRQASVKERSLLQIATVGGYSYMKMYREYMEKALAETKISLAEKPDSTAQLKYTLENYQEALERFNWNWAHTCDINAFLEGQNRMKELKSVALQKKGPFLQAWNNSLEAFQKTTHRLNFA